MIGRIVIVGNGIAGLTAADSLRAAGFDGELTIVGDERHPAYSRPALSKAPARPARRPIVATADPRRAGAPRRPRDRARPGAPTGDPRGRHRTSVRPPRGGHGLAGASPVRGAHTARARRRARAARPSRHAAVGRRRGRRSARHGARLRVPGRRLQGHAHFSGHAARGATRPLPRRDLRRRRARSGALAEGSPSGAVPEADLRIAAVGDVPNTEWLAGTGLVSDGAVRVDSRGLATPEIAAVGDLAAFPTPYGMRRIPLWTTAIEHGKVAAPALLHGDAAPPLRFQPYFWTEQFGLSLKAAGFLAVGGPAVIPGRRPLADALDPGSRSRSTTGSRLASCAGSPLVSRLRSSRAPNRTSRRA